jgi:hypothetical protein
MRFIVRTPLLRDEAQAAIRAFDFYENRQNQPPAARTPSSSPIADCATIVFGAAAWSME